MNKKFVMEQLRWRKEGLTRQLSTRRNIAYWIGITKQKKHKKHPIRPLMIRICAVCWRSSGGSEIHSLYNKMLSQLTRCYRRTSACLLLHISSFFHVCVSWTRFCSAVWMRKIATVNQQSKKKWKITNIQSHSIKSCTCCAAKHYSEPQNSEF